MFVTTGGVAPTGSKVKSRLAFKLSEKSEHTYAEVMGYIRIKASFAALKSSVLCLHGCRSLKRQPGFIDSAIGAIVEEGRKALLVEPPRVDVNRSNFSGRKDRGQTF